MVQFHVKLKKVSVLIENLRGAIEEHGFYIMQHKTDSNWRVHYCVFSSKRDKNIMFLNCSP